MVINDQLLACMAYMGKIYHYAKLVIRVNSYLQVLTSSLVNSTLNLTSCTKSIKSCQTSIIVKQSHNSLIKNNTLINYVLPITNQSVTYI
jgi:hypothetical protein